VLRKIEFFHQLLFQEKGLSMFFRSGSDFSKMFSRLNNNNIPVMKVKDPAGNDHYFLQ